MVPNDDAVDPARQHAQPRAGGPACVLLADLARAAWSGDGAWRWPPAAGGIQTNGSFFGGIESATPFVARTPQVAL